MDLKTLDNEVYGAIKAELLREKQTLVMIASENYASKAVMQAQSSVLTNKYAEGYPAARYYGGCEHVDRVEMMAIDRARRLFKSPYANVQPHSGSQANMAVYLSVLKPGDTILGMDLVHGGHLTHGSRVNFSGIFFNAVGYGLNPNTHNIDFDAVMAQAREHRPRLIIAGASSYPRVIDFECFREIASEVNAYLMADMAHIAGLVAADLHPSPVGVADFVTLHNPQDPEGPQRRSYPRQGRIWGTTG